MPSCAAPPLNPLLTEEGSGLERPDPLFTEEGTGLERSAPLLTEEGIKGRCGTGFATRRKNQKVRR
jgi:hypothetical protein